jgi:hypothetical protein
MQYRKHPTATLMATFTLKPETESIRQITGPHGKLMESAVEYFSFPKPAEPAVCADVECPCPKEPLQNGSGYLYVSPQVITERRRNPESDIQIAPLLLCREAARKRDLDLKVAAEDASHWWNTGSVAMRASPRRELKFQDFEGLTVEEAKARAKEVLGADLIGIDVLRDVQDASFAAQGDTEAEALEAARARVPAQAFDVQEPAIIQQGGEGGVEISGFEESEARRSWRRKAPRGSDLVSFNIVRPPKKGLVGIGKQEGTWNARWAAPFYAEVKFKMPAAVQARYFG